MALKNHRTWSTTTKRIGLWAVVVGLILMIPVAFNFPWTAFDFVFAGTVLFGAATVYELITRMLDNKTQRIVVGGALFLGVMAIWAWAVA